jgi:tRNA modification GTPase
MDHSCEDTIAAIVTPVAAGGLGVIRISGRRAKEILTALFVSSNGSNLESHRMIPGWLFGPADKKRIDQIMACFMQSPKTYTGEDVVELFCHGSVAVLEKALQLAIIGGARLAKRGEFTKRAFLNGKIDLAQAEGVLDLVSAQTIEGAGYAIQQLNGRLSNLVNDVRKQLMGVLAEIDGEIDFPDDFPERDWNRLKEHISGALQKIDKLLAAGFSNRIYRAGLSVVIVGKPNVGKSSLLNALLDEERVIVTATPGTTRDAIEETMVIKGLPLKLIDTAGLDKPGDNVEKIGMERTNLEIAAADFLLVVIDGARGLDQGDEGVIDKVGEKGVVFVLNKIDIAENANIESLEAVLQGRDVYRVSAKTKEGIDNLKEGLYNILRQHFSGQSNSLAINARHKECFIKAQGALARAIESCNENMAVDFISIDLKEAVLSLGEITGELVSEEVINTIFEQFCVGK